MILEDLKEQWKMRKTDEQIIAHLKKHSFDPEIYGLG